MSELQYTVDGMSCQHCVDSITREVSQVTGVTEVAVDLGGGTVTVRGEGLEDVDGAIREAIDEAGYDVTS